MAANGHVTREEIERAKEIDLLTYLQRYDPTELVKCGKGFCTRTHDSLKISNGLWHWHSRGIGGRTALDYLIHVKGMDFAAAVRLLCESSVSVSPAHRADRHTPPAQKPFMLPEKSNNDTFAIAYLIRRGIDFDIVARCLENGTLYESKGYHNAVFIGKDESGTPRYAMLRATDGGTFKMEMEGSDKRYAFSMAGSSDTLIVAESAIDALSIATILRKNGEGWRCPHYLSLGGISEKQTSMPKALAWYLDSHPSIGHIRLMLDNDTAGRGAARHMINSLCDRYDISAVFPTHGKDFNDEARWMATNTVTPHKRKEK